MRLIERMNFLLITPDEETMVEKYTCINLISESLFSYFIFVKNQLMENNEDEIKINKLFLWILCGI